MLKRNELINKIIQSLQMTRYYEESYDSYIARIIYSALSIWIRVATLDRENPSEYIEKVGRSKRYIRNICTPFLENMLDLYPMARKWFYPNGVADHPITIIRDRLCASGELIDVGFDGSLAIPEYEECNLGNKFSLIRGICSEEIKIAAGLAQIQQSNVKHRNSLKHTFEFYGMENRTSYDYLRIV